MRVSTVVLIVAFLALFWVYHNFEPRPAAPPTAVVPPGFVPDPNYTWVPRTNVRRPKEPETTTTTTSPTETTATTSPGETTSPSPPSTTVIDPDGSGPLPAVTIPLPPALLTPTTTAPASGTVPATPALP
jgi:cytoskeletal protein RodZ